jgi:hypothetical protein
MDRIKFSSLYEKFMVAVDVLATCPAPLQKRLEGAYRSFIDIEPKDFDDEEMQTTFEQIRSRLTRVQYGQIDSIAATCRQMSDQEAAEVADFIFSLFSKDCGEASLLLLSTVKSPMLIAKPTSALGDPGARLKCPLVALSGRTLSALRCPLMTDTVDKVD